MHSRSRFAAAPLLVLALLALTVLAVGAGSADALVAQSSEITTPAGPILTLRDLQAEGPAFPVSGTATGMSEADILCYHAPTSFYTLAKGVTVSGGAFSATVALKGLPTGAVDCRLRAVPSGTEPSSPPGEEGQFRGPLVAPSDFDIQPTNYGAIANTFSAYLSIEQAEECGLESTLYNATTKESTPFLFYCNGAIKDEMAGSPTANVARIDSSVVYGPYQAGEIEKSLGKPVPGAPTITIVSKSFDPASGNMTITERDPWVHCAPEANAEPTSKSCKEFVSAGVTLERTWRTSASDEIASMTDSWQSTDGQPHAVAVEYFNEFQQQGTSGAFEFPGTASFAGTTAKQAVALPAGAGTIFYKTQSSTPDTGDATFPQGAVVYDRPPSGPLSFKRGTSETGYDIYLAPYTFNLAAGGSSALRMTFIQDFSLVPVRGEAAAALAGFAPSISIAAPVNGATVETESPSVVVSGSASDTGALAGVGVNGVAATIGAGGAWSATVPLKPGANTITATATDQGGLTKSASITLTYKIPPGKAALVGKVSASKGKVTFTLKCTGAAGSKCSVKDSLTTVEKRRGSKILGLLAAHTKKRTVTVASGSQTIPAGKTVKVTLKLNATGRTLLKRFHKLPAHLTVTVTATPKSKTVISKSLTVTPAKHRH